MPVMLEGSVGGLAPGSQKCFGSRNEGGLGKAFLTVADEESSFLGLTPSASSAHDQGMCKVLCGQLKAVLESVNVRAHA